MRRKTIVKKSRKRLPGGAERSQRELERRIYHLKTLHDLGREIGYLKDTEQIIKNLLMMVIGTFGALSGFILIINTSKRKIEAVTHRGMDKHSMDILCHAVESGYFDEINEATKFQILLERYKGQKKDKKKQGIFEFLSSLVISIWIPFKMNAAVEGVLGLGDKLSGDPYTQDDQELLTTLANEGALAIENAISHQEVVRYAASLEASLRRIQILDSIRSNLAKFVPKTVQDLIEQSPEAPLFDKRETDVSVLFADITGYTRLSSQMELGEVNKIVERYFGAFLDEVLKHGGDVNETAGDGLMVIFQDADPQRHARQAVLAALAIQQRAKEINTQLQGQSEPIEMHIGVNSGIAAVGATKIEGMAGTRWTYTASGPTTNIAARLATLGKAGAVILSEETRHRIGDEFEVGDLGLQTLKNLDRPIQAYRLMLEDRRHASQRARGEGREKGGPP